MIEVVCALIENQAQQLLACKRAAGTHLGGCWEFPGGKVEHGENNSQALQREIREELGIEIEVGEPLRPVEWGDGKVTIRLLPYLCTLKSGVPTPHEHEEIQWCDVSQLKQLKWAPADLPILAEWEQLRSRPE